VLRFAQSDNNLQLTIMGHGFALQQCVCDRDQQRLLIRQWADGAIQQLHETRNGIPPEIHARTPTNWNIAGLAELASRLKHPSFKDEREWQLVSKKCVANDAVLFRPASSYLVPFLELDLGVSVRERSVSELWIDPTPSIQAAQHSAGLIAKN
jgi:hypothetical protein